jgi:nicotinamidase/pyrazinamidase
MKTIFYEVDVQYDFMFKEGALYVPGAEELISKLIEITGYAKDKSYPIVGSVDRHFGTEQYKHREGELQRWGGPFPDHCMEGRGGKNRVLANRAFANDAKYKVNLTHLHYLDDFVEPLFTHCDKQGSYTLFFEKQSYDVFTNPALEQFLKVTGVERAIVYGVATDYCVKAAAIGMAKRGIEVYVLTDAIKAVSPETEKQALEEMKTAGVKFAEFKDLDDILGDD